MLVPADETSLRCDLCNSKKIADLPTICTGKRLRSDRTIESGNLHKLQCLNCGLVFGPISKTERKIDYHADYDLSHSVDYQFYTKDGPILRSKIFARWLVESFGAHRWLWAQSCLEIGASDGALIRALRDQFHTLNFTGIELNTDAVRKAKNAGLPVEHANLDSLKERTFDIIYMIAVLEHVNSPRNFLKQVHDLLTPNGLLFISQPCQDVPSYDVFFSDHLHHFGVAHLRQYAEMSGFSELGFVIGHELMPNFSLHLWRKHLAVKSTFELSSFDGKTLCAESARSFCADMQRLDQLLIVLANSGRRVGVFGVGEVFWLTCAYSKLGDYPILCGLDDQPNRLSHLDLGFMVVKPEEYHQFPITDVILCMNKIYYSQAEMRMSAYGLKTHTVFK